MDGNNNIVEMQHVERTRTPVRDRLKLIDPKLIDPARLQWLWEQVMKEDYASDDFGAVTPELFISNLFLGNSEHFELGDEGYAAVLNIVNYVNADIHFAIWGDTSVSDLREAHQLLADRMYNVYNVNRITAYIPAFNKKMVRLAVILGYRYEGELRKIFLKHGEYYDLTIYGLLKEEYLRRKVG